MIRPSASMLHFMCQSQAADEMAVGLSRQMEAAGYTNVAGTDEWVAPAEQLITVEQAAGYLRKSNPDMPELSLRDLQQLGKDCVLYSNIKGLPVGQVAVTGKAWPTEKAYTFEAIREAFRLHPATKAYVPQEAHS